MQNVTDLCYDKFLNILLLAKSILANIQKAQNVSSGYIKQDTASCTCMTFFFKLIIADSVMET